MRIELISEGFPGKMINGYMGWSSVVFSVKRVKAIAERVIPGHDRVLRIEKDRVVAQNGARRTIIVPENVVDIGAPRYLELTLEPTCLPFSNGL